MALALDLIRFVEVNTPQMVAVDQLHFVCLP